MALGLMRVAEREQLSHEPSLPPNMGNDPHWFDEQNKTKISGCLMHQMACVWRKTYPHTTSIEE